jgi:ATP-binding cassette subfamily B protein
MDCGPTCLRMVAKYYGKNYSLQYLRSRSYLTREGVFILGISETAEHVGFRTKGYQLTWEELRDDVPLPCIVHWKQQRYFLNILMAYCEKYAFLPKYNCPKVLVF